MPVKIQHNRGDIRKRQVDDLKNGQFFWSYINEDPFSSNGHSFSRGQLWIKDPSSDQFTEIADRRTLDALRFRGFINAAFDGSFVDSTQQVYNRCHTGDFFIFSETPNEYKNHTTIPRYKFKFFKGDILLITNTEYKDVKEKDFADELTSVDYIRIPGAEFEKSDSDLDAEWLSDAIVELEGRLNYKGEVSSVRDYFNLEKRKGNMYIFSKPVIVNTEDLILPKSRETNLATFKTFIGDFIYWNGNKWVLIPSGSSHTYIPNSEEIDSVPTFDDAHRGDLKSPTTVSEAIDILNKTKASLDSKGKVPLDQLPDLLQKGLFFEGTWTPTKSASLLRQNDPDYQNNWPTTSSDSLPTNGQFWIVDTLGLTDVQYVDKDNPDRVIELNSGDWIVWVGKLGRFEIVDNSNAVSGIKVYADGKPSTLKGLVELEAGTGIKLEVSGGNKVTITAAAGLQQDSEAVGRKNYFSKYKDEKTLTPGPMYHETNTIFSEVNFQVGSIDNSKLEEVYGDLKIRKSTGTQSASGYLNHVLQFESFFYNEEEETAERWTRINSSMRRNFARALLKDTVDITLPETDSLLVGILDGEELTPGYLTKASLDGFITETLNSEVSYSDKYFKGAFEEGFLNVGYGRTTSEDLETGEITFYAKTSDKKVANGFYTEPHSFTNEKGKMWQSVEHKLHREVSSRTHLVINPNIIAADELENFVKMPRRSGTLLLWEDFFLIFGNGVPLMIPAWEKAKFFDDFDFVGLDTSPITIKLNRVKKGLTSVDRTNDLSKDYGTGDKSTWSYIDSSKEGSLQDDTRGSVDDVVFFNSWLESQRSIATKEAFIIPAAAKKDGLSSRDPITDVLKTDKNEIKNDTYGVDKKGGKFQRILPSRTLYPDEATYYDWHTGQLIPQDSIDKDVEMPAVGGVLLTSRSRIDGGLYS